MLSQVFLLLFVAVSILTLVRIQMGFVCILVCRLSIPANVRVSLGVFDTPLNNLFIGILLISLILTYIRDKDSLVKFDLKWFYKPFVIFFLGMALLIPFAGEQSAGETIKNYFQLIATQFVLVFVGWSIYSNKEQLFQAGKVLFYFALAISVYGVYCYLTLSNPYIALVNASYAPDLDTLSFMDRERGGLAGRIQGTMGHPLTWGGACMLLAYYLGQNSFNPSRVVKLLVLFLLILNVVFSGSRAALLAVAIGLVYFYVVSESKVKIKLTLYSALGALVLIVSLYQFPQLSKYQQLFESTFFFWDTSTVGTNDEIKGSSMEMRINQFYGAFDMIDNSLLTGLGQGYTLAYSAEFGPHPVMKGFESIVFMGLVETGIIGMALWIFLFLSLFRMSKDIKLVVDKSLKNSVLLLQGFFVAYALFIVFTGLQGTLFLFLVLYSFLLKYLVLSGLERKMMLSQKRSEHIVLAS